MAEERVKEVKLGGPGGRGMRGMPRAKVDHPGQLFMRLMKYVFKYYAVHMIVVMICIVVSVLASVQGTMFTKTLIDSYITPMMGQSDPDYGPLLAAMGRVALFYGIGIAASFTQARVMVYVNQGTLKRLREELFSHMESLPVSYFDTHSHGDIMSVYTNDIDTLRQMISQSLPQLLNSAITIVSIFSMMIVLSIPLTALTVAMVFVMMAVSVWATKTSGRNFVAQQKNLGSINGFIEETMSGEKVVKVFCHEEECKEKFDELNEELYQSAYKANAYSNILGPITSQLGNTSYVLCAMVGGMLALNSYLGFTVGGLASFLTFNKSFNMPINQVTMQFNSIISALAGAQRVFALLDEKPEADEGYVTLVNTKMENGRLVETADHTEQWAWKHFHKAEGTTTYQPLEGDVTFNDVDFGYTPEKMVLHDIVIHAKPGQKIALVGSTGAGKTTITNLINRFYDIQDGKIRFDDINVNKIRKADLRRSLGVVLQDTHLFTDTVRENIRYGKLDATDEEVEAAAKLANADSFIRRLPKGYDTELTGDGANLSQGQRQLLAIARAAVADPPVLILDEATSSIDTRTEKIVQDGMDKLMKGRTTFVIAHRLSTIRNSDVIIVLEQGRIVEQGTHEQLLDLRGRYYQLWTGKKPELAS
ncbi:MAG: ABC transporter ATP-binding protein/permease [Lachnospiraceae bacterium]|jgi:ATP-binding cassette subfamily B multidrug efflux pump|nr:ABC transporter ATP-binding protein/permease [Lachnospiraceae bacterium]